MPPHEHSGPGLSESPWTEEERVMLRRGMSPFELWRFRAVDIGVDWDTAGRFARAYRELARAV